MTFSGLDNPIWFALTSAHREFSDGDEVARRYLKAYAPFIAVREPTDEAGERLLSLVDVGERVGILGVMPEMEAGWSLVKQIDLFQYEWREPFAELWDEDVVALTCEDIPAMLELTALVYPAYFREETAALGQYFGIYDGDRLCGMAGVRMTLTGYREISAVCTHPDYRGRGIASRLSKHLVTFIQEQGDVPFLHTEFDNVAAQAVYERLGMTKRRVIPFRVVDRV